MKLRHQIDSSKLIKPTEVHASIQSCCGPLYAEAMKRISKIGEAISKAGFEFSLIDDGNAKLSILCHKKDEKEVLRVIDNFFKN